MNVSDLVLHPSSQTQLDAFLATPAHAVLLSGPTGTGKTRIATTLAAQLLNVDTHSLDHYAYYKVVAPPNGSIGIEQIRELIGFFKLTVPGNTAIKRVAVLQNAETMGTEAQNALLKLLEEPPLDSVLILTVSQPARLLSTIRSRAQLLQLPAPDVRDLQKHFAAAGYTESAVKTALLRSGTNIAEALRLLTTDSAGPDPAIDLAKQALASTSYDRLLLVDMLAKQKELARAFVETLAAIAIASLEAAASKGATTVDRWRNVLQVVHTAQDALDRSGNTKLVLTELMLAL